MHLCILTCSEETIDVHSLLLSISPYSSHGLDTVEREKFARENDTHVDSTIWWICMYMSVIQSEGAFTPVVQFVWSR